MTPQPPMNRVEWLIIANFLITSLCVCALALAAITAVAKAICLWIEYQASRFQSPVITEEKEKLTP